MHLFSLIKDRTDQRSVEYPFVYQHLPGLHVLRRADKPRLLDVGCVESELAKALSRTGKYEVWAIDIRDYDAEDHPIKFVKADIRDVTFPDKYFDIILAISTIEHVGLKHYDNSWMDPNGDIEAMHRISQLLKDDGTLILTVDAGKIGTDWFRVYNEHNINRLTDGWKIHKIQWYHRKDRTYTNWFPCPMQVASNRESKKYADACVCMVLRK